MFSCRKDDSKEDAEAKRQSPTGSKADSPSDNGKAESKFKRDDRHEYDIQPEVNVVITHGRLGVYVIRMRLEPPGMRATACTVAKVRPRMHVFDHIHESWGAGRVGWDAPNPRTAHTV